MFAWCHDGRFFFALRFFAWFFFHANKKNQTENTQKIFRTWDKKNMELKQI